MASEDGCKVVLKRPRMGTDQGSVCRIRNILEAYIKVPTKIAYAERLQGSKPDVPVLKQHAELLRHLRQEQGN